MKPTLVVLAAGIGNRYGGLKQVDAFGPSGETIIDYSVFDAVRAGFGRVVFVIRRSIEKDFREAFLSRLEGRIDVRLAFQELGDVPAGHVVPEGRTKPWGTTHAVLAAASEVGEPFAAINADDFYGRGAYAAMAGFLGPDNRLTGIVERLNVVRTGGRIRSVGEDGRETALAPETIVSMNFWGFTPAFFGQARSEFEAFLKSCPDPLKSEIYIPLVVNNLIRGGRAEVRVLESTDAWFGVTYREDKPRVMAEIRALVEAGVYPNKLWA